MAPDSNDTPTKIADWRERIDAIDDRVLELLERARSAATPRSASSKPRPRNRAAVIVPSARARDLRAPRGGQYRAVPERRRFGRSSARSSRLRSPCSSGVRSPTWGRREPSPTRPRCSSSGRWLDFEPAMTTSDIFAPGRHRARSISAWCRSRTRTRAIVSHTLDLFVESELTISAEIHVPIHHDLLSRVWRPRARSRRFTLTRSRSRSVATGSSSTCPIRPSTPRTPPRSRRSALASTARSPRLPALSARDMYSLKVVRSGIRGQPRKHHAFSGDQQERTQAERARRHLATVLDQARPGGSALHALEPFHRHEVNLTRIESRPTRSRAWEYVFFADFEGHRDDPQVAAALSELTPNCDFVKVLGSYPRAKLQ